MKKKVGKSHVFAFIGTLILLGIHTVWNHRKAWSTARVQVLYLLHDLLTCQLFELISTFIQHPLKRLHQLAMLRKPQLLIDHNIIINNKRFEFYQPRRIDERMVKSRPGVIWSNTWRTNSQSGDSKLWVLADMTGYAVDFNIHTGRTTENSDSGLGHDVVMQLVPPLAYQGYELYCDTTFIQVQRYLRHSTSLGYLQLVLFVLTDEGHQTKWYH